MASTKSPTTSQKQPSRSPSSPIQRATTSPDASDQRDDAARTSTATLRVEGAEAPPEFFEPPEPEAIPEPEPEPSREPIQAPQLVTAEQVRAVLAMQGEVTHNLLGRNTPDRWRWTDEELDVMAEAGARVVRKIPIARGLAGQSDELVVMLGLAGYVMRNTILYAEA
ncbi:MAG TPA: hypothetical protein VJ818_08610, partial [Actinomycetota bacterium]|nr:hypothetical protein [Actinomycetota bacterium]